MTKCTICGVESGNGVLICGACYRAYALGKSITDNSLFGGFKNDGG